MLDVSQCQHFDALMKTCDWQMKAQRLQLKTSSVCRALDQPIAEEHVPAESKPIQQRRRYFRRSAATSLSESKFLFLYILQGYNNKKKIVFILLM